MARLNEPPVMSDSLETLRKKMLRQNRDLAKSNNIRALRIRELENECASILSENLQLRGRILELEKRVQDNEAQRIADHALAIKEKLESQLTEWGTLLAGLGLESPLKRHSPRITRPTRRRTSFYANRPSPSQRRLRDISREINDLGHISENKSYPRQSMKYWAPLVMPQTHVVLTEAYSPEEILALRSEADEAESPVLGPPPISTFIEGEPVKTGSPSRTAALETHASSPRRSLEPPITFSSPQANNMPESPLLSPEKPKLSVKPQQESQTTTTYSIKLGSKRKLAARDDVGNMLMPQISNNSQILKASLETPSLLDKAAGKTLKELAAARRSVRGSGKIFDLHSRPPLAAKSTNEISSPKKGVKSAMADGAATTRSKLNLAKRKASQQRSKTRSKANSSVKLVLKTGPNVIPSCSPISPRTSPLLSPSPPPPTPPAAAAAETPVPLAEPTVLLPSSPEVAVGEKSHRGDTPPPTDISSRRETTRSSRRNRAAISYAEPNLRDKMRRPSNQLFDAVAGESKNPRRLSQAEMTTSEARSMAPEAETETDNAPLSPQAGKNSLPQELRSSVATERRRRPLSSTGFKVAGPVIECAVKGLSYADTSPDAGELGDVDIYEVTGSSLQSDDEEASESQKANCRCTVASRRPSAAADEADEGEGGTRECSSARRRSMIV